ncbi:MAG: hypothetical protein HYT61_01695 [Candidatus Yanofskybacteria bacterium]|nr:hypothetical protein [Candidatus Yanofskybacteria bacterium]
MSWQTIGFDKNQKLFENFIQNGGFAHAYLFTGQEMIGKRTFAFELANHVISGNKSQGNNPDILTVSPASSESWHSIAIEEIRKIKKFVSLSSYVGPYKFVIIDDAHLMTIEAQNSLLKILEEPSPSTIFILVTANPESLLTTIVSRCQEIKFSSHPKKLIANMLIDAKLSNKNKELLTEFANGRLGLIKKIVEENSFDEVKDAIEEVMHLIKSDINERLAIAQKLADPSAGFAGEKNKTELAKKILYWTLYLRTRLNEPKAHKILKNLLVLHEIINKPQFNQRLALENFLIQV